MKLINYFQEMWQLALIGDTRGVFFWGAIYAFVILSYSLINQIRTNSWPSTIGELIQSDVEKFGATEWAKTEQHYVSSALYKYRIGESDYEGYRISPWVFVTSQNMKFILEKQMDYIQPLPDGKITIYYNPGNPKKSFLIKPGIKGQVLTGLMACIPFMLYWLKYHV